MAKTVEPTYRRPKQCRPLRSFQTKSGAAKRRPERFREAAEQLRAQRSAAVSVARADAADCRLAPPFFSSYRQEKGKRAERGGLLALAWPVRQEEPPASVRRAASRP